MSRSTRKERRRAAGGPQGGVQPGQRAPGRTTKRKPCMLMDLDAAQQTAAFDEVHAWLTAWKDQSWGEMASHCQLPQAFAQEAFAQGEAAICAQLERRLGPNVLESFSITGIGRGHSEMLGEGCIGFVDFNVIGVVRGTRVGIRPRVVYNGNRWGVNYLSINRRFDPDTNGN